MRLGVDYAVFSKNVSKILRKKNVNDSFGCFLKLVAFAEN